MISFELKGNEFIELNKLLKITGLVDSGGMAKIVIQEEEVLVDNEIETRIRRKVKTGMVVSFRDKEIKVVD